MKKKIDGEIINIGSVKNNLCKKLKVKKSGICFISSFGISSNKFEKRILNYLSNFCKKKELNSIFWQEQLKSQKKIFENALIKKVYLF